MSQILIISATSDLNLDLAKDIQALLSDLGQEANIMELEKLELPLFGSEDQSVAVAAKELTDKMISASAFIFCAPEYNGGLPPILTNSFTWISVTTANWRDGFKNKYAVIATSSAGSGQRFLVAFRSQLEYMGTLVMPKTITVTNGQSLNRKSAERTLHNLTHLLSK